MERIEITGNLGADAEFRNENGNEFIKFNVGVTDRYEKQDGTTVERVTWYGCILNGRQEKLLPYLRKGTRVFVRGEQKLRVYSSEKDRAMKAGANVSVRELELIGGKPELVPAELCDENGLLYKTLKFYWVAKPADGNYPKLLKNPRNTAEQFIVSKDGYITPMQLAAAAPAETSATDSNQTEVENVEVY